MVSHSDQQPDFPPMSREEMKRLGWDECDVIIVTGDAYVDHPSFGSAVIARVLMDAGFRVGTIAQPRWDRVDDFQRLGRPRLFFGVTAGNVDSMVNLYSPLMQKRRVDDYSPGGKTGLRPSRATIVYCGRLREAYPGVKLVLGGIEASLRRLAHYDYWDDAVRRSILLDAKANILAYGMAELAVVTIARRLSQDPQDNLAGIPGTVIVTSGQCPADAVEIPSEEETRADKDRFLSAFMTWYRESDQPKGRTIVQRSGNRCVVQYPPALPLSSAELDRVYDLPFQRRPHPGYERAGEIPALEMVKFSITSHRGCLGSCTFCSLRAHQGRISQWRSQRSIVDEARRIARLPGFRGHITDIGGPTANMYGATCPQLANGSPCRNRECLFPERCPSLRSDLGRQLQMLATVRALPGVKRVSIGTGLRYDLFDPSSGAREIEELARHYISGQLRIAPEHVAKRVLDLMRKSSCEQYERFMAQFEAVNRRLGKKQYLIPYFISGFPGCTAEDMVELAEFLAAERRVHDLPALIRQVQDFTPLPMTPAAAMYYTGKDPFTGRKLYVARDIRDKKLQRALLQLAVPANYTYACRALRAAGQKQLLARVERLRRYGSCEPPRGK
jgi:uncharacterized radical SAM protein YgiQ